MDTNRNITICYIDDILDDVLGMYLHDFAHSKENVEYVEHKFLTAQESYKDLLCNQKTLNSDIIIIDSKLFEDRSVLIGKRLTGEMFKVAIKADFPYKKIFVISSKPIEESSTTIKKFDPVRAIDLMKEAQMYYEGKLSTLLEVAIKEIKEQREIIPSLNSIPDMDKVKSEKISNMEKGIKELDDIKKSDIDELIAKFQEIKDIYE